MGQIDHVHLHLQDGNSFDRNPVVRNDGRQMVRLHQLRQHMRAIGPMPKKSLATFADLGLSDAEIGRYFKIPRTAVAELRDIWSIGVLN